MRVGSLTPEQNALRKKLKRIQQQRLKRKEKKEQGHGELQLDSEGDQTSGSVAQEPRNADGQEDRCEANSQGDAQPQPDNTSPSAVSADVVEVAPPPPVLIAPPEPQPEPPPPPEPEPAPPSEPKPEPPKAPKPKPKPDRVKYRYGRSFAIDLPDLQIEQVMFRSWRSTDDSPSRFFHFQRITQALIPDLIWNPWLEEQIRTLCEFPGEVVGGQTFRNVAYPGCAASGKTFSSGLYAMIWWLCAMDASAVILTSTTKDMIKRRVWPVIQDLHSRIRAHIAQQTGQPIDKVEVGHLQDSRQTLQCERGDDKHSITAMAVRDGETQKAVANLKGQHVQRIFVVIDEASACPEAIYATIPNLRKACADITVLSIANPASHFDAFGRIAEPVDGWNSIGLESTTWLTRGVPEWQTPPGIAVRFRGTNSPNVKARRTLHPFLYSWEDYQASHQGTREQLGFWMNDEGFWAPDGACQTVLTEGLLETHQCFGRHDFVGKPMKVAGLDPAFGGDKCVLRIGEMGKLESGGFGLQLSELLYVPIRIGTGKEAEYQIADYVIEQCTMREILPQAFGMDATGTGRGVFAIIANDWSSRIRRIEFGGAPSDMPAGINDARRSKDVYDRRVTELWFSVRDFAVSDRLKGLDRETAQQLCKRQYEKPGKKYELEDKKTFKGRWGYSPDEADALAVLVETARQMGFRAPSKAEDRRDGEFKRMCDAVQAMRANVDYSEADVVR